MTEPALTYLGVPRRLAPHDEGLHAAPPEAEGRMFGDTVWLSAIDPGQGIWGLNHMHVCTNRDLARFQAYYCIDGVEQIYLGTRRGRFEPGAMSWSDGTMSYEVIEPFGRIRVTLDHRRFGFEFEYTARHVAFDYDDCVGGSPLEGLAPAAGVHGGHYEQALDLRGTFEIRSGPAAGETRTIDTIAHRDHTWSDRFSTDPPWTYPEGIEACLHYWHVLQFPSFNLNVTGFFDLSALGIDRPIDKVGGFVSNEAGVRRIVGAEPAPVDGGLAAPRGDRTPLRWRYRLEDGEVLHISMSEPHWVTRLRMLGEDDSESRLNDYETFGELVLEETGEHGFGQFEHSTLPPNPRWLR